MNRLSLFTRIIAWLADASNGITNLFAGTITATQKLCVADGANDNAPLCVTKAQLAAVLSQSPAAATPISVPSPASNIREPEPPESVSSTTSDVASSTPEALPPEPANDNPPPPEATSTVPR